jgi:hypothetical protein
MLSRRSLLEGAVALTVANVVENRGFARIGSVAGASGNTQPAPGGSIANVSAVVETASVAVIQPRFCGLSFEKNTMSQGTFTTQDAGMVRLFKLLGPSLLRIGGNSVDRFNWTPNGGGTTKGEVTRSNIDQLAQFCEATGWLCLYGVNLGGSANGSQTPEKAAEEVAYVSQRMGNWLWAIEIGNECDAYRHSDSFYPNWNVQQFIALWEQYRKAIVARTPNVRVTGPGDANGEDTWTVPFGEAVTKEQIVMLTQHFYRSSGRKPTDTPVSLVTHDANLDRQLEILQAGAAKIGVPYRLTECNTYYSGQAGASDAFSSALWSIDFMFACAFHGCAGVNFHTTGGSGAGGGYTPITHGGNHVKIVNPEYYGILLFAMAGGAGDVYRTTLDAGPLNATAYTIKTPSGLSLLLLNKDTNRSMRVTARLPQPINHADLYEMSSGANGGGPAMLTATTGVTLQGSAVGVDGSYRPAPPYTPNFSGNQLDCFVPAVSAVLVRVT